MAGLPRHAGEMSNAFTRRALFGMVGRQAFKAAQNPSAQSRPARYSYLSGAMRPASSMPHIPTPPPGDPFRQFGAVFVISRKGPHQRKRDMAQYLEEAGIAFEFFEATMGVELPPEELAVVYDEQGALNHRTIPRKLHPSHVGSCLSHRRACAEVEKRGLESALILEDDAKPVAGNLSLIGRCLKELPPDWDLLYLGIRGHRRPPFSFWTKRYLLLPFARLLKPAKYRFSHAESRRLYLRPYSKHLDRAGYHQGMHAYAVSRKGAAILYAHGLPVTAPVDVLVGLLIVEGKLNAFAVREDLFVPSGAPSQIVSAL